MCRDGVEGIPDAHRAGAPAIDQNEGSSLVYGMPGAAFAANCAQHSVPLTPIPCAAAHAMQQAAGDAEVR